MATHKRKPAKRATITLMVVGLLAMLFVIVSAYITLARHDHASRVQLKRAQNLDGAIDSINDLLRSLMVQQFVDADGNRFGGSVKLVDTTGDGTPDTLVRGQFEDIAGSGGSRFIGALEPFFDYAATTASQGSQTLTPFNLRQFVTSTSGKEGTGVAWAPSDSLPGVSFKQIVASQAYSFGDVNRHLFNGDDDDGDWAQLARSPFMDADGIGVPDSSFEHLANLHELVNAAFGRIVNSPDSRDPINAPFTSLWILDWERFDLSARYEVAVKVVPHGGMIAIDSYQDPLGSSGNNGNIGFLPFNRQFVREMLDWLIHPDDSNGAPRRGDRLFNEIFLDRRAIEPLLRRRGGLASWAHETDPSDRDDARIPDVLRDLEERWQYTFVSRFGRDDEEMAEGQRVNIAATVDGGDGIDDWARAVRLDPQELDLEAYDRRHLASSISTSDELARKLAVRPEPNLVNPDPIGTVRGQLKFFLGDIANANRSVSAFNPPNTPGRPYGLYWINPNTGRPFGDRYVRELSNLFYDMLSGHSGWIGDGSPTTEAVTREEQALMLAVNAVAFAAPRTTNPLNGNPGFIDVVAYTDLRVGGTGLTYIGYAPQPFFSEAMMYFDHNNNIAPEDVALAVEFHNPNEPTDPALAPDQQALDLTQFAIGFEPDGADWLSPNDPNSIPGRDYSRLSDILDPPARMAGRTTVAFAIHQDTSGNTYFEDNLANSLPLWSVPDVIPVGINLVGTASITLNLWRQGSVDLDGNGIADWHLVDEILLSHDNLPAPNIDWYVTTHRDTTDDNLYQPSTPPVLPSSTARWGVAVAEIAGGLVDKGDPPPGDPIKQPDASSLGTPDMPAVTTRVAPAPPLYTMNAGIAVAELLLHNGLSGDLRPTSFPTPGFMLFVPRFSHVVGVNTASAVLKKQWDKKKGGYDILNHSYPADFGHMPIFDDHQDPADPGYFRGNDRLPWGLLVFDYVTNIDPQRIPGGDPLRVPGRININAAPWYVLAGLPVIVPKRAFGGNLPIAPQPAPLNQPSPAFWSVNAGVLIGGDPNSPAGLRFDKLDILQPGGNISGTAWHRLGGDLAVAAVSYRDRAAYRDPDPSVFLPDRYPFAHNRNVIDLRFTLPNLGAGVYRNTLTYGNIRREDVTDNATKFGFVSIGELLNVKGFDTATRFRMSGTLAPVTFSEVLHPGIGIDPDNMGVEYRPDFMKAVSLMALLDTQFLTTRSNTFTIYVTVFDRENPQASVRSQITVDRGNTLPKLANWFNPNGNPLLQPEQTTIDSTALPEIIAERRIGYFNTVFDD